MSVYYKHLQEHLQRYSEYVNGFKLFSRVFPNKEGPRSDAFECKSKHYKK